MVVQRCVSLVQIVQSIEITATHGYSKSQALLQSSVLTKTSIPILTGQGYHPRHAISRSRAWTLAHQKSGPAAQTLKVRFTDHPTTPPSNRQHLQPSPKLKVEDQSGIPGESHAYLREFGCLGRNEQGVLGCVREGHVASAVRILDASISACLRALVGWG